MVRRICYAGTGSRSTPEHVLRLMRELAAEFAANPGWHLLSGALPGADTAFEEGCDRAAGVAAADSKTIWIPKNDFFGRTSAEPGVRVLSRAELRRWLPFARTTHPNWYQIEPGTRGLHLCSCGVVEQADFVVCWTPDGAQLPYEITPGTGRAAITIRVADALGRAVFNLARPAAFDRLQQFVRDLKAGPRLHPDDSLPTSRDAVLVFGSNLAGRHDSGTAKVAATHFNAFPNNGYGPMGRSWGIPVKDGRPGPWQDLQSPRSRLALGEIARYVRNFTKYARAHPETEFFISAVGCEPAGHAPREMASLFRQVAALPNCSLPNAWAQQLGMPFPPLGNGIGDAVNIDSNGVDIAAALSNRTRLARRRGRIDRDYPVVVEGQSFPDADAAYGHLWGMTANALEAERLMIVVLHSKIAQYPKLEWEISRRGGEAWLRLCTYLDGAEQDRYWTGTGMHSRFIRCLTAAWRHYRLGIGPGLAPAAPETVPSMRGEPSQI